MKVWVSDLNLPSEEASLPMMMRELVKGLLERNEFSLCELEKAAFVDACEVFLRRLRELLEVADEVLMVGRDVARYDAMGIDWREVDTRVGLLRFRRRRYWDLQEKRSVYLLDEALRLEKFQRVSEGLLKVAVAWAVEGPSYRAARDKVADFSGYRALSHETIRRYTIKLGERAGSGGGAGPRAGGGRRAEAVFVAADGLWVSLQGDEGGRREVKTVVAHEGWEVRQGAGKTADWSLVRPRHFSSAGRPGELWRTVRGSLGALFADLDRAAVVVCGDDARWIREGLEYFGNAMFQRDRYHVVRDVGQALAHLPERRKAALEALEAEDIPGLLRELVAGKQQTPPGPARDRLGRLVRGVAGAAVEIADYRTRLERAGRRVSRQWRGAGVAESQVKRYKQRLGGRSWSRPGLEAMLALSDRRFDGTLDHALAGLDGELEPEPAAPKGLLPRQVPLAVGHGSHGAPQGHFPVLDGPIKALFRLFKDLSRA